jgi:hypothetical protein
MSRGRSGWERSRNRLAADVEKVIRCDRTISSDNYPRHHLCVRALLTLRVPLNRPRVPRPDLTCELGERQAVLIKVYP